MTEPRAAGTGASGSKNRSASPQDWHASRNDWNASQGDWRSASRDWRPPFPAYRPAATFTAGANGLIPSAS